LLCVPPDLPADEYEPALGGDAVRIPLGWYPARRLHTRAIIRDGVRAFVGSQSLRRLELEKRREAARAGRTDEMRAIFHAHLAEPAAQVALGEATALAGDGPIALLCYEHEARCCHRAIVADEIRARLKCEVVDL